MASEQSMQKNNNAIALYQSLLEDIKQNPENMKKVLDTGCNVYRYSFAEQLLISYARPDATAVATYAQWNQLRCVPQRGSHGIAVPQKTGVPKYLFDIKDVKRLEGGRLPHRWTYDNDMEQRVVERLNKDFGVPKGAYTLSDKIMRLSDSFAKDISEDLISNLADENRILSADMQKKVTRCMTSIMAYSIMTRMGLDTDYYEKTNQINLGALKELSVDTIASLSAKIINQSGEVLHSIAKEVSVIEKERSMEYDRENDVSSRGRLYDSRPETGTGSGRIREMGDGISQLHGGIEERNNANVNVERTVVAESNRETEVSRDNGNNIEKTTDRNIWNNESVTQRESVGMGASDETDGYGNRSSNNERSNLLVTSFERGIQSNDVLANIPSQAEQMGNIITDMLKDNSVPDDVRKALDTVLEYLPDEVKGTISAIYEVGDSQPEEFIAEKMAENVPVLDKSSSGIEIDTGREQIALNWNAIEKVIENKIENDTFVDAETVETAKKTLIEEKKERIEFDFQEWNDSIRERIEHLKNLPYMDFPLDTEKESDTFNTIRSINFINGRLEFPDDLESAKNETVLNLRYAKYKKDSIGDENQLKGIKTASIKGVDNINALIERLELQSSHELSHSDRAFEPVVTIHWSEHDNPLLGEDMRLSLSQADSLFHMIDDVTRDERNEKGYDGLWYYKTSFDITYVLEGEVKHYEGRQDFGDGDGGLISHIEMNAERNIEIYNDYELENKEEQIESWQKVKDNLLPYLQLHIKISEIEDNAKKLLASLSDDDSELHNQINTYLTWVHTERMALNNGEFPEFPDFPFLDDLKPEEEQQQERLEEIAKSYPQIKDIKKEQPRKTQEQLEIPEDYEESVSDKESHERFKITDDYLGEGTPREKYARNMDAIKTMKSLEFSGIPATHEEKEIMSRYVGWGGLADVFDERKDNWGVERQELKSLLSEDEYKAAKASTLDAFYTSPTIIRAIYEKLADMGLKEGRLLEPSCGVGNFIGTIPDDMELSVTGVELDSITGRIAKQIYPETEIQVKGFEKTDFANNTFDVAVGNVPFGTSKPYDKEYNKDKLLIHDYFFNKTLDKVKPNGVVAFITSSGTMDKKDSHARELMSQKAYFLGAIRLPNTAFKKNAGTEVVSDIIFLQKKEIPDNEIDSSFVNIGKTENGIDINKYFSEHPEMICGTMEMVSGQYGFVSTCRADESRPLEEQIKDAMTHISGKIEVIPDILLDEDLADKASIIDREARNYSYVLAENQIYFKENTDVCSLVTDKNGNPVSGKQAERIKGLCRLRDITYRLLDLQTDSKVTDEQIKECQKELLDSYNRFQKANGRINDRGNNQAFREDDSYCLLTALEKLDDNNKFIGLADIFTERTVVPVREIESVDSPKDALIASLNRYAEVDLEYMSELCGISKDEIITELVNKDIFLNPATNHYESADEYLSGNVRQKLKIAEEAASTQKELFQGNVEQLRAVQPIDLAASEISVRLGATWIEPEIIKDFMQEKLDIPNYYLGNHWRKPVIDVDYNRLSSEWRITGKHSYSNPKIDTVFGVSQQKNGLDILEASLNLKPVRVMKKDENDNSVVDEEKTKLAMAKQEQLQEAFKEWIFDDPDRREKLVATYNEQFNSIRPREYDGSNLSFDGLNPRIELKPHQKEAVARQVFGGNTLLAHCVGAGKTFTMAAAGMELKRIGICKKPLFVVPKPLVGQWAKEFATLYPTAKILAAGENDFTPANRKKFTTKIATGNYDAIIISHGQFHKIPLSNEYLKSCVQKDIDETMAFLEQAQGEKNGFSVKQAERTLKNLEERMERLTDIEQDNVVTFENLGVDHLFVDESHTYKNLPFHTKMQVAGINGSDNKSCTDMLYKCQYLNKITNNKGVTFATGTPVSNSMTELYANMKYLQPDVLEDMGCNHFDQWAANFGNTVTAMEFDVTGKGFHQKTRFAEFYNLPELMSAFKEAADVRTPDMLDLDTPDYKIQVVDIEPSEEQMEFVEAIVDRCEMVRDGIVDPKEDNMLAITTDGRKLAFDQRMLDSALPENPNCKINVCVDKAFEIYQAGMEEKHTQMIFSDLGVPNTEGRFDAYHEIKNKLMEKGVPEKEIAIIHDFETAVKKAQLQEKMRAGEIRFLIGSTQKCGTGLNVQTKLKALHHLDVPWRPSDIEQREGRIIRQGNENKNVDIFRYVTKQTFDTYSWQIIEQKQKFVGQIMTSKTAIRSMQDVDNAVLEAATAKAIACGNQLVIDKANLEKDVAKLKLAKASYKNTIYTLQDDVRNRLPNKIADNQDALRNQLADSRTLKANNFDSKNKDAFRMLVNNTEYTDKKESGAALIDFARKHGAEQGGKGVFCGEYKGFKMYVSYDFFAKSASVTLQGKAKHSVYVADDPHGMIIRLDNVLEKIDKEIIPRIQGNIDDLNQQLVKATEEIAKPFSKENELKEKESRLAEINAELEKEFMSKESGKMIKEEVIEESVDAGKTITQPSIQQENNVQETESVAEATHGYKDKFEQISDSETVPINNDHQRDFKNFVIEESELNKYTLRADVKGVDGKFNNVILKAGVDKDELKEWAKKKGIELTDKSESIPGKIQHKQNVIKDTDSKKDTPNISGQNR